MKFDSSQGIYPESIAGSQARLLGRAGNAKVADSCEFLGSGVDVVARVHSVHCRSLIAEQRLNKLWCSGNHSALCALACL